MPWGNGRGIEIEHDDVACLVATPNPTPFATILIGVPRRKTVIVINKVLFNLEKSLSLMLFAAKVSSWFHTQQKENKSEEKLEETVFNK